MKYAPKKVFIKENEIFIEITNEKHESRKATDEQYAKRWFVPLQGCLLEVDEQFYIEYYKEYERNRYLAALDRKNKVLSIEAFDSEDDNGVDFIVDEDEDVEKQVTDKLMAEHIRHIVSLLPSDERELIEALYACKSAGRDESPQGEQMLSIWKKQGLRADKKQRPTSLRISGLIHNRQGGSDRNHS